MKRTLRGVRSVIRCSFRLTATAMQLVTSLLLCATSSGRLTLVQSRSEALTGIIGARGVHGLDDLAAIDALEVDDVIPRML